MKRNLGPILFSLIFILAACDTQTDVTVKKTADAQEIINADKAFSDMSRQLGMKKAYIQYISKEGALLRPGHMPIIGADAIDFLSQINDTAYTISWVPSRGDIASSGDLGYTFGVYTLATADTTLKGTYVRIWKKQPDGDWKFFLDTSNEGVDSNTR